MYERSYCCWDEQRVRECDLGRGSPVGCWGVEAVHPLQHLPTIPLSICWLTYQGSVACVCEWLGSARVKVRVDVHTLGHVPAAGQMRAAASWKDEVIGCGERNGWFCAAMERTRLAPVPPSGREAAAGCWQAQPSRLACAKRVWLNVELDWDGGAARQPACCSLFLLCFFSSCWWIISSRRQSPRRFAEAPAHEIPRVGVSHCTNSIKICQPIEGKHLTESVREITRCLPPLAAIQPL